MDLSTPAVAGRFLFRVEEEHDDGLSLCLSALRDLNKVGPGAMATTTW